MSEVILHYFNINCRGDTVRFALFVTGTEFTENQIPFNEWPTRMVSGEFEFQVVPVLDIDGVRLQDSICIAKYLLKKAGMHSYDLIQECDIEAVNSFGRDIIDAFYTRLRMRQNDDAVAYIVSGEGATKLGLLQARYQRNGVAGHIVGNTTTLADVHIVPMLYNLFYVSLAKHNGEELLNNYPQLKAYIEAFIAKYPAVQNYLETRPKDRFI